MEGVQSSISNGRSFRAANVWPRRKLSLMAAYGPSLWEKSLTASELIALIDAYRGATPDTRQIGARSGIIE